MMERTPRAYAYVDRSVVERKSMITPIKADAVECPALDYLKHGGFEESIVWYEGSYWKDEEKANIFRLFIAYDPGACEFAVAAERDTAHDGWYVSNNLSRTFFNWCFNPQALVRSEDR